MSPSAAVSDTGDSVCDGALYLQVQQDSPMPLAGSSS